MKGSPTVRSQCAYSLNSPAPKKIFRFPIMWTTRYDSMISPLTAITVFLPTELSHTVRAMDGRRSVRVARAMSLEVRGRGPDRSKTSSGSFP